MLALSTGRYSILRGSTLNDYGDEIDGTAAVAANVLGSVVERTRTNFDPATSRVSTIRYLVGRFGPETEIRDGDRIRDDITNETFLVTSVARGANLAGKSDVVVDLTKV